MTGAAILEPDTIDAAIFEVAVPEWAITQSIIPQSIILQAAIIEGGITEPVIIESTRIVRQSVRRSSIESRSVGYDLEYTPRPSIQFTPPGEHRPRYRCGCTRRNAQGQKEQCQYHVFPCVRGFTFEGLNNHSQEVIRRYLAGARRLVRAVCAPGRLSASAR
jgi:hypothetical protein